MAQRSSSILGGSAMNLTSLLQALPRSRTLQPESTLKCSRCLFSTTSAMQMKRRGIKRKNEKKDPYREAQALQRKNANLAKRKVLQAEREAALGDPIMSTPTPFINSLNLAATPSAATNLTGEKYLNYFLIEKDKEEQLKHSEWLTEPLPANEGSMSPAEEEELAKRKEAHKELHSNATVAVDRIVSLQGSSSKDRTRINVQRCIETFGRHNTDSVLPPKPASLGQSRTKVSSQADDMSPEQQRKLELMSELAAVPKRAGPDTGSSEVQIAILTAKINVLAGDLHKKDKHNKRSLRLLVHRRQKLLAYLRRKERGGPRWQNIVEQLGINDAMWKGEISL